MNNPFISMNANPVVAFLQKRSKDFTKADIIRFVQENNIRMVNFMYPGGDGKLKTLNFVITNEAYLDTILTCGERVDGSSLFSFIEAGSSDLYVLPRYRTAARLEHHPHERRHNPQGHLEIVPNLMLRTTSSTRPT